MKCLVDVVPQTVRGRTYYDLYLKENVQDSNRLVFRFEFKFVNTYSNEYYLLLAYFDKVSCECDLVCKEQTDNTGKVYRNLFIRFNGLEYRIMYPPYLNFNSKFDFKLLCKLKDTHSFYERKTTTTTSNTAPSVFESEEPEKKDIQIVSYVMQTQEKKKKSKEAK